MRPALSHRLLRLVSLATALLTAAAIQADTINAGLDPTFGAAGKVTVDLASTETLPTRDVAYAVAVQDDGRIVIAGESKGPFAVIRLTSTGLLDPMFGSAGKTLLFGPSLPGIEPSDGARDVVIQPDGKIIVGGVVTTSFFPALRHITGARLSADGMLDQAFGTGGTVFIPSNSVPVSLSRVLLQGTERCY